MSAQSTIQTRHVLAVLAIIGLVLVASLLLVWSPVQAQQNETPTPQLFPITFGGTIDSLGPRFIVVNGLMVDLDGADVAVDRLRLGAEVTVVGNLEGSVIRATQVRLADDDRDSSRSSSSSVDDSRSSNRTGTVTSTPTPNPVSVTGRDDDVPWRIAVRGPVREIGPDYLRIFDLVVAFDPEIVDISNIRVGNNVRVLGDFVISGGTFSIAAVRVTPVSATAGRDSIFSRISVSDRDSILSRISVSSRRSVDSRSSVSDRDSDRVAPPPPPPPPTRDDSSRSSISGRSSRSS